jgi:two-component system chemotaxis response regulator CheY
MTHVLIVDDNENNRLSLQLLLEEFEDLRIQEAQDGKEALERCETNHFELIFMDIMMPVMDGIEATKAIKKVSPKSMVIALSALEDEGSKHHMFLAGAEDYLTKPIESELFTQRIRNYLNIIHLRTKPTYNFDTINPFCSSTYHRKVFFAISCEEALAEFWDYTLNEGEYAGYSDVIRVVYGLGLWFIQADETIEITLEQSEAAHYLSLRNIHGLKPAILTRILTRHLPQTTYTLGEDALYFDLPKLVSTQGERIEVNEETKSILSKRHDDGMSAKDYVENTPISIMPKIDALEELEDRLDAAIIDFENSPDDEHLQVLYTCVDEYHQTIELLTSFDHLAFAIQSLSDFLKSLQGKPLDQTKVQQLATSLLNLLHDLTSWRNQIFIQQDALNIHYLDASLLSSCMQAQALFEDKEIDEGDDLEFF